LTRAIGNTTCLSTGLPSKNISELFPIVENTSHWKNILNTSEECPVLTSMLKVEQTTVAVLVVGAYRIFDGTWPSLFRSIIEPVQQDPNTQTVDLFTCFDLNRLPPRMPPPAAAYFDKIGSAQGGMFEREARCFDRVQVFASSNRNIPGYDFYIRTRPDIMYSYPMAWPLASRGDPFFAEAYATVSLGNLAAYPWAHMLTANMIVHGGLQNELNAAGWKCPRSGKHWNQQKRYNDPCFDIADTMAILRGRRAAEAYFFRTAYPPASDAVVKQYRCSSLWDTWANEARITHRLRHQNITIAPHDMGGYFLVGARKIPMKCDISANGSVIDCLSEADKKKTRDGINMIRSFKDKRILCLPGNPKAVIPMIKGGITPVIRTSIK